MKSFVEQNPALVAAYQRAIYEVQVPKRGLFQIQVGQRHPQLDAYLREAFPAFQQWAFLTAWNPRASLLADAENEKRQIGLCERLVSLGVTFLRAEGRSPLGGKHWREASLLALNLPFTEAVNVGKEFEQNAMLVGKLGGPAELTFLVDSI